MVSFSALQCLHSTEGKLVRHRPVQAADCSRHVRLAASRGSPQPCRTCTLAGAAALALVGAGTVQGRESWGAGGSGARRLYTGPHIRRRRRDPSLRCCDSFATAGLPAVASVPGPLRAWVETLPVEFAEVISTVESVGSGHRVWVVGGALRDVLSGAVPNDIDLCTTLTPEQMMAAFPDSKGTGAEFGTVTIEHKGLKMECTSLRTDSDSYSDGRRPDSVEFGTSLHEDLTRRDFTMNAMALDARRLLLYDPFGGVADCEAGLLRAVGDASARLQQDALRVMRAYRYLGAVAAGSSPRLPDAALSGALQGAGRLVAQLSRQRLMGETRRILGSPMAAAVVKRMLSDGVLEVVLAGWGPANVEAVEVRALESLCGSELVRRALALEEGALEAGASELGPLDAIDLERFWLESLVLLLGRRPAPELEQACKALELRKKDQAFVLKHGQCLAHLPDSASLEEIRCYASALGEDALAPQLRLESAWEAATSASFVTTSAHVRGVRERVEELRPGSVAPRALVDGRWVMERTGLRGPAVGKMRDWLYFEQVVRDIRDVEGIEAILRELPEEAAALEGDAPRVEWPPSEATARALAATRDRGSGA